MAHHVASSSFKTFLWVGVASCVALSGCNKMGYGEKRTAPQGQAVLGAKRVPTLNQVALASTGDLPALNQNKALMGTSEDGAMMPSTQQTPAMNYPAPPVPEMAPVPPMIPPQGNYQGQTPYQPQSQLQLQPQIQQQYSAPIVVQPVPEIAAANPYGSHYSQSHQPAMTPAPVASLGSPSSSYPLPYEYAEGSYYEGQAGSFPSTTPNAAMLKPVSIPDYYTQDSQQRTVMSSPPAQIIREQEAMVAAAQRQAQAMQQQTMQEHQYQQQQAMHSLPMMSSVQPSAQTHIPMPPPLSPTQQWQDAAPIPYVQEQGLPMSAAGTYNAGYGMDAAYGRYQNNSMPVMPPEQPYYHPMLMTHQGDGGQPPMAAPAPIMPDSQYNNFYYGGQEIPQGQNHYYSPNKVIDKKG